MPEYNLEWSGPVKTPVDGKMMTYPGLVSALIQICDVEFKSDVACSYIVCRGLARTKSALPHIAATTVQVDDESVECTLKYTTQNGAITILRNDSGQFPSGAAIKISVGWITVHVDV